MIGIWSDHTATYAVVFAIVSSLVFALPFVFAPMAWGRALRWSIPADGDLARYFARCLGLLALSFNAVAIWGALRQPAWIEAYLLTLAFFSATMVPLHVYGWAKREQPWTETAEIPLWAAICLVTLAFLPGG